MYRRVASNTPYDELVAGIVLATGRAPDQSYEEYAGEMSSYFRETDPADFAARDTMPFFWTRRDLEKPEDKALAFAHSFLGVNLVEQDETLAQEARQLGEKLRAAVVQDR